VFTRTPCSAEIAIAKMAAYSGDYIRMITGPSGAVRTGFDTMSLVDLTRGDHLIRGTLPGQLRLPGLLAMAPAHCGRRDAHLRLGASGCRRRRRRAGRTAALTDPSAPPQPGARLGDTSDLKLQGLEVVDDGNGAEPRPLICPARRSVSRVAPSPHRRERIPRLNDAQQRELGEG